MASRGQDLIVNLVARTQQFGAQLRSAGQSLRNFGDQAQTTSQRTSAGFDVIGDAAKAYVGVQGARALLDAAMAAGALEDSIRATERVFGASASVIGDAADDSAERWGLTEQQFRQMAANTGQQLQNFGMSADEAANATLRLTDRARDMATNAGLPMQQAIDAIGAALRGERDPIEQFGVSIKQADINARLAAEGLSGLEGESRKLAEAQVAIDAIFEQSASTVGAFSESATADIQIFQASLGDLQAQIGEDMIPALNELAGAANLASESGLLEAFFTNLTNVSGYAASGVEWAAEKFGDAGDASDSLAGRLVRVAGEFNEATGAAGGAAGAVGAAGASAATAGSRFANAAAGVNTFAGALARIAGNVFSSVDATSRANSAIQSYNTLVSGSGGGGGGGGAAGATRNLGEEQKKAAQNARRMQEASEDLADAQKDLLELETELSDLRKSESAKAAEEIEDAEGDLEKAKLSQRSSVLDLRDAEDNLKELRRDSDATNRDLQRAEIRVREARIAVRDAAKNTERAEQQLSEKRKGNTDVAKDLKDAEEAVADAQERVEDATLKAGDAYVQAIKPAQDLTGALGGGGGGGGGLAAAAWEVEAAAADAAREIVDAAADFAGVQPDVYNTRDAFDAWIDKIDELAQDIAPGSPLRRYLDELLGVLLGLQRTAPTVYPDGRYGPPVGGVPGRQQNTLGGGATTVTVNLDGRKIAEATADANRNSGGFIN